MFKGTINPGTYTNGYLPLVRSKNTNRVFALNSDHQVSIKKSGIVDVKVNIVVTSTANGSLTAQLYGNGEPINGAIYTVTTASGNTYTLTINDAVLIANAADDSYATIGVKLSGGTTLVGGDMICEYRQ